MSKRKNKPEMRSSIPSVMNFSAMSYADIAHVLQSDPYSIPELIAQLPSKMDSSVIALLDRDPQLFLNDSVKADDLEPEHILLAAMAEQLRVAKYSQMFWESFSYYITAVKTMADVERQDLIDEFLYLEKYVSNLVNLKYLESERYEIMGMVVIDPDNPIVCVTNMVLGHQRYTTREMAETYDVAMFIDVYRNQGYNVQVDTVIVREDHDDPESAIECELVYLIHTLDDEHSERLVNIKYAAAWIHLMHGAHVRQALRMGDSDAMSDLIRTAMQRAAAGGRGKSNYDNMMKQIFDDDPAKGTIH